MFTIGHIFILTGKYRARLAAIQRKIGGNACQIFTKQRYPPKPDLKRYPMAAVPLQQDPHSTRETPREKDLELAIGPYKSQLRSKRGAILRRLEKELDEVMSKFSSEDFKSDKRLSGEFLLSYHCQRRELWNAPKSEEDTESVSATR
jgi:hypothetical protein